MFGVTLFEVIKIKVAIYKTEKPLDFHPKAFQAQQNDGLNSLSTYYFSYPHPQRSRHQ